MQIESNFVVKEIDRPEGFPALIQITKYRETLQNIVLGTDVAPIPIASMGLPFAIPCSAHWDYGCLSGHYVPPPHAVMPTGNLFGGYLTGLVDQWAGLAVYSVLPDALQILTVNINMNFTARACAKETRIQASVIDLTERKAIVQVLAWQLDVLLFDATVTEVLKPWAVRPPTGSVKQ